MVQMNGGKIYCSVIMDEMHIKKDVHFDGQVNIFKHMLNFLVVIYYV